MSPPSTTTTTEPAPRSKDLNSPSKLALPEVPSIVPSVATSRGLLKLPPELKSEIFSQVGLKTLYRGLALVSKEVSQFIHSDRECKIAMGIIIDPKDYGGRHRLQEFLSRSLIPGFWGVHEQDYIWTVRDKCFGVEDWAGEHYEYNGVVPTTTSKCFCYRISYKGRTIASPEEKVEATREGKLHRWGLRKHRKGAKKSWMDLPLAPSGIKTVVLLEIVSDIGASQREVSSLAVFFNLQTAGDLVTALWSLFDSRSEQDMLADEIMCETVRSGHRLMRQLRKDATGNWDPSQEEWQGVSQGEAIAILQTDSEGQLEEKCEARMFLATLRDHHRTCDRNNPRCQFCVLKFKDRSRLDYLD